MGSQSLQSVIEELKSRGLRAGEEEGSKLVDESQAKADKIVADARAQAEKIVAGANTEAASMRKQLDAELRQASSVGLEAFRQAVENSFLVPTVEQGLAGVLEDPAVLKEAITATVSGFASSGGARTSLEVLLPEAQQAKLDAAFVKQLITAAGAGTTVTFTDGFKFGFKIAPEGSGYVFDFSDEGFKEIFLKFLAPRFRTYFFDK